MYVHITGDGQHLFASTEAEARAVDPVALREHVRRLAQPAITLILPHREAPLDVCRDDPDVTAFAIHEDLVGSVLPDPESLESITPATMLALALARTEVPPITVLELRSREPQAHAASPSTNVAVIVPHLGRFSDLRRCARSVRSELRPGSGELLVGLDHDEAMRAHDVAGIEARIFRVMGRRVGPYPIRNQLADIASAPMLAFQDSDDLPMAGRFAALAGALDGAGPDWVGSHEMRLDPIAGRLTPVRYPLDVNAALSRKPRHALLLPTSAIKASTFRSLGGFSDYAIHSLDTEFTLRAHLMGARIANVDRFLYLRVARPDSLTGSTATGLGTLERRSLLQQWLRDFVEVQAGRLGLDKSSLALRRTGTAAFVER